jgi:hypothetical protein
VPIRESLWLVRNGVPFDTAFQLDDATRTAFAIVFSEFEGNEFDFNRMEFKEHK